MGEEISDILLGGEGHLGVKKQISRVKRVGNGGVDPLDFVEKGTGEIHFLDILQILPYLHPFGLQVFLEALEKRFHTSKFTIFQKFLAQNQILIGFLNS